MLCDKHYSDWMYIWNDLSLPKGKTDGYAKMVGADGSLAAATTLYVPLEFWFCRNVGLALPLIALQYHEVKINIEFEQFANCVKPGQSAVDLTNASLWVDYIFLDTDERRRFAQLSHEYLIEQLQFTGEEAVSATNNRIKLNFNHPVKELVWVIQSDTMAATASNWFNFTDNASVTDGANLTTEAKLQLNGHDRFAARKGDYFNLVQPFQHHENTPSNRGISVYSFALKPEEHQPSGTLNMSRIDTAVLSVTSSAVGKIKVFATSYNVLRIMSGRPHHAAKSCVSKIHTASRKKTLPARILVAGTPLEPILPRVDVKTQPGQENNLGMVIMDGIGQSAWLDPKDTSTLSMERRQRLNGIPGSFKNDLVRYSPCPFGNNGKLNRWEVLLTLTDHHIEHHQINSSFFKVSLAYDTTRSRF